MEEWEAHIHLSGGKCFEMNFNKFNQKIRFKIIKLDSNSNRTAVNCETKETFEFNIGELHKIEYSTVREISCEDC